MPDRYSKAQAARWLVEFSIVIETVGGAEMITLVRGATRGDRYRRPESLERIETPEWPISPEDN